MLKAVHGLKVCPQSKRKRATRGRPARREKVGVEGLVLIITTGARSFLPNHRVQQRFDISQQMLLATCFCKNDAAVVEIGWVRRRRWQSRMLFAPAWRDPLILTQPNNRPNFGLLHFLRHHGSEHGKVGSPYLNVLYKTKVCYQTPSAVLQCWSEAQARAYRRGDGPQV